MTPTDIDSMPAGPEMDAMVAEKVMGASPGSTELSTLALSRSCRIAAKHNGWITVADLRRSIAEKFSNPYGCDCEFHRVADDLPPYSTSDAAALEVFKKLVADGVIDTIQFGRSGSESPQWEVGKYDYEWMGAPGAEAHTLALAVCRAALKATL